MSILNATTTSGVVLTGDTTGNLTIQSAGTNVATFTSGGLTYADATTQSSASGVAKAWGKNNGGASGIVSSYNVSSITYNSTGNYTVAFTNAFSDANYAVMSGAFVSSASLALRINSQSTTGFTCETLSNTSSDNNAGWAFSVFR